MYAPTRIRSILLAGVAVLAVTACSSNSDNGPSPAPPTASLTPTSSPSSSTPTPTGAPLLPPVDVTNGSAAIRVTGAFKETITLSIASNGAYQPSPGEFSVSYVGRAGNALIVSGTTPLGRERTSSSLTLSLVVQGKKSYVFASAKGECSITPTEASRDRFGATFACKGLKKDGKTIGVTGRFLAFA